MLAPAVVDLTLLPLAARTWKKTGSAWNAHQLNAWAHPLGADQAVNLGAHALGVAAHFR